MIFLLTEKSVEEQEKLRLLSTLQQTLISYSEDNMNGWNQRLIDGLDSCLSQNDKQNRKHKYRQELIKQIGEEHELVEVFDSMPYQELSAYLENFEKLIHILRQTSDIAEFGTERLSEQQHRILKELFHRTQGTRTPARYSPKIWFPEEFSTNVKENKKKLVSFSKSLQRLEERNLLRRKPIPKSSSKRTNQIEFTSGGILAANRLFKKHDT